MITKTPRRLAAILVAALFGGGSAALSAAPVAPRQIEHEVVATIQNGTHVVDKAGHETLQVLIFIHRANLSAGVSAQGTQR